MKLRRSEVVDQAALADRVFFDPPSLREDGASSFEVGVGRRDIAEAPADSVVVVVVDEVIDGALERVWQLMVLKQDPVFQCLMPALDLALGLRMVGRAADMVDTLVLEPFGKVAGDGRRAVAYGEGVS